MNRISKKLLDTAAEILNDHVQAQSPAFKLLTGEGGGAVVDLINEIIKRNAEGGRLVTAVETSGELIGFVPRTAVPIPDLTWSPAEPPDESPEG